ncbi:MAG: hydrogenase nickel incorporation protein HypB [Calditrichaeota bacterium]|nr:hydrogenase nickel incorporation protein HypB [Calditrichota bacterium]
MDIPIIRDVLEESNARAEENRAFFDRNNVFVINLMGSPGSGKTTILEHTIPILRSRSLASAVIEGDITTTLDSDRLSALDIPIVQANTEPFGGDCHVGSHLVQAALSHLNLKNIDILFIENIGNLVCPAEFYLGEDRKVVVLSLPEGEDKPLKYPLMFRECQLCLLSKADIERHLDLDREKLLFNLGQINGALDILTISAKTGAGLTDWVEWIITQRQTQR